MAKMLIAFSGRQESNQGNQSRNVSVKNDQIYDPGKHMPSSPVSPYTPEQPGHVTTPSQTTNIRINRNALARMGYLTAGNMENVSRSETENRMGGRSGGGKNPEVEEMRKKMKRMASRMEHMEKGSKNFAEGGEVMYGAEVLEKLPQMARKAAKVIKSYPETWDKYLEEEDYQGIYEMESKELEQAMEEGGKNLEKECSHVLAALTLMCVAESEE